MDEENTNQNQDNKEFNLQLTYKGLTEFPDYLLTDDVYKALNLVYLSRNRITKLPENLSNLSSLTGLFLNHNKIQYLPEEIGCLKNLEFLNVTGNELSELPTALGKLLKLQKLNICNNNLTKLPSCIGNLSELRVLEVTNNKLTSIPVELSCCENIETLNLDKNRLTFLPRQLRKLVNLGELSAVGNNLYVLPQEIGRKDDFRRLYVDNNQRLYTLPSSVLRKHVGFYCCATKPLSSEILGHFSHVYVRHTKTDKLPILLPPDLQHVCSMNHCVPSLLELALRVTSDNMHPTDIEGCIPYNLTSFIKCPTAQCETCKRDIFLSAFPVVFKRYLGYILGMCCSLKCVKKCYQVIDLPLIYPTIEDMSLALALVL